METFYALCFVVAAVLFLVSALADRVGDNDFARRVNVQSVGLFFFVLPFALRALEKL